MKKHFIFLLLLTVFFSCNFPTEISVPETSKGADKFSKDFIDHIINAQADSAFAMIDQEVLNDNATSFVNNAIRNINGTKLINVKVIECTPSFTKSFTVNGNGSLAIHRLDYEYQFDKGYILFTTIVKEKDGRMSLTSFDGKFLNAPVSELTKFTIEDKSFKHYLILVFMALVPVFILVTLVVMFISKIPARKKGLWFFLILFLNVIRFSIDWSSGELGFNLINLNFMGGFFFSRGGLSPWILGFYIPLGAILFWIKRKSLLPKEVRMDTEPQETNDIEISNDIAPNEQ